jgi:spermidine synthase
MKRTLLSVALLSCALIAFQLVLMQALSHVQWYHFAYMIISVALLGFGASGTVLALARDWFLKRADVLPPLLMMLSGVGIALSLPLSQYSPIRFDSYLLFVEGKHIVGLVLTYLVFFVPFLFGALAIGLLFLRHAEMIGKFYAANLAGSGAGGAVALGLMWLLPAQQLSAVVALLALTAGVFLVPRNHWRSLLTVAAGGYAIVLFIVLVPPVLHPSEYKSISRTLALPNARVVHERSSPYGIVQIVSSPSLRYAPGLSLTFPGAVPAEDVVFNNGDWFGPIVGLERADSLTLWNYSTLRLPYVVADRERVLVLQARTGLFAAQALQHGARRVVVVEPHRSILSLLMHEYAKQSDSLLLHPAVEVHALEPRSFLMADTSRFDLIVLPTLDAFGGTSGVYALQEQYLLTKEAFAEMWERLTPSGVIAVTSWMDQPVRNPLRVLATMVAMLADAGVVNPGAHIAAVRSWGTVTFAVKRTPLTTNETERVLRFCNLMQFDPLLLPNVPFVERNKHNVLYDVSFFRLVDGLLGPRRDALQNEYEFRISPPTDDRPYFSQFLRWSRIARLRAYFGQHALPFLELGSFLVALTLVQIALLAIALVVLPLLRKSISGPGSGGLLLYFAGLGLGYMFVEMVLIQRMVLYLGHPLYAAAATIGAMLIFSGLGSLISSRLAARRSLLRRTVLVVALLVLLSAVLITPAIHQTITLPLVWKFILASMMIAPIGIFMGMPFPLGVRAFGRVHPNAVAWAWGVNGCASVVAAPLATMVAIEAGFTAVMIGAAGLYLVAALSVGVLAQEGP